MHVLYTHTYVCTVFKVIIFIKECTALKEGMHSVFYDGMRREAPTHYAHP